MMTDTTPVRVPAPSFSGPDLTGRTALVTGSFAGLGYAIAEHLGRCGANVVLHGIEEERVGEDARARLAEVTGRTVLALRADLTQVSELEALMQTAVQACGGIDIVVNNAVIRHFAATENLPTADWDAGLAVNLSAAFHTARLSIASMRERGWGRIINLSSVYGAGATVDRIGYVTAKTGLIGMTRAIALETATSGITCNAVSPGTVPTPAIQSRIEGIAREQGVSTAQAERDYLATRQPTGRFVAMQSVAELIAFLCGEAGRDITGAVLPIDGGWTAA